MARMNRATTAFVRREAVKLFRRQLPGIVRAVATRLRGNATPWSPWMLTLSLDALRPGVELMEAIPGTSRGPAPTKLERYEAELRRWKRRRTIAQSKVAKYARLVRYHRKGVAK